MLDKSLNSSETHYLLTYSTSTILWMVKNPLITQVTRTCVFDLFPSWKQWVFYNWIFGWYRKNARDNLQMFFSYMKYIIYVLYSLKAEKKKDKYCKHIRHVPIVDAMCKGNLRCFRHVHQQLQLFCPQCLLENRDFHNVKFPVPMLFRLIDDAAVSQTRTRHPLSFRLVALSLFHAMVLPHRYQPSHVARCYYIWESILTISFFWLFVRSPTDW